MRFPLLGRLGTALTMVTILTASPAYATLYFEAGDAGTSAETAQYISWDTETIFGAIHNNDGADVYGFEWAGGFFVADTKGSDFDTMLSLFDTSGSLHAFNDDAAGSFPPFSQLALELDPGNYFLGITYYPNNYHREMRYYLEEGIEGFYQIQKSIAMPAPQELLVEADPVNVPEPASIALVVAGLAGIMLSRRRKPGSGSCGLPKSYV